MKNSILIITLALTGLSFTGPQEGAANAERLHGLYIFLYSQPADDYEYLGKVNMPEVVWSGETSKLAAIAVKRAKRQYKQADAVIVNHGNFSHVDAIRFRE